MKKQVSAEYFVEMERMQLGRMVSYVERHRRAVESLRSVSSILLGVTLSAPLFSLLEKGYINRNLLIVEIVLLALSAGLFAFYRKVSREYRTNKEELDANLSKFCHDHPGKTISVPSDEEIKNGTDKAAVEKAFDHPEHVRDDDAYVHGRFEPAFLDRISGNRSFYVFHDLDGDPSTDEPGEVVSKLRPGQLIMVYDETMKRPIVQAYREDTPVVDCLTCSDWFGQDVFHWEGQKCPGKEIL